MTCSKQFMMLPIVRYLLECEVNMCILEVKCLESTVATKT